MSTEQELIKIQLQNILNSSQEDFEKIAIESSKYLVPMDSLVISTLLYENKLYQVRFWLLPLIMFSWICLPFVFTIILFSISPIIYFWHIFSKLSKKRRSNLLKYLIYNRSRIQNYRSLILHQRKLLGSKYSQEIDEYIRTSTMSE